MADEKTLGFKIAIDGISNEATELQKLTIQLQNLNKEYKDLQKTINQQGGLASNDQLRQLAAYSQEIDNHKDSIKELVRVQGSAEDSLVRMRTKLIDLKDQYANGSAALRSQLTPEINKLTTEVGKAEQAIGVHSRGVGNYTQSIKNAVAQIFSIAAPAAAAAFALNGLKTAFAGTEAGANLLGRAKVQLTAFFDAIVEGRWRYAFGNELPKDIKVIGDLMNKVRIDERAELVAVSEKELQIKDLRIAAIKAGKDTVEQVRLLTLAEQTETDLIQSRLNFKGEELDIVNKILAKDPVNTAALDKQAQLQADINNILGDRSIRIASQLEKQQEKLNAELDKTLSKSEEIALKASVAIKGGWDKKNQSPILQPFDWKASDEVAAVKYKDKVKFNIENIGNLFDKGNAKVQLNQEKADKAQLELAQKTQDAKLNIARGAADLINAFAGKNKALQKAALITDKALAIAEIIIQTQKANAAMTFWGAQMAAVTFGASIIGAEAIKAKNRISEALQIAAIVAATVTGLAGFSRGGKINRGIPVNTGTVDNRLIAVNNTETVLTARHVAMLGGSGVMNRIGVPGYASGGYIGSQSPPVHSVGFNPAEIANLLNSLKVVLNVNELNRAQNELNVIHQTNRL